MTDTSPIDNQHAHEDVSNGLWYHERHEGELELGLHVTRVLHSEKSEFQRLDVFETSGFGRLMTLDGLVMVTERDEFVYHEMIAHVPLLAHPQPERVLIIGGGDGGTLREVLRHKCVKEAVLCEIDGAVVEAARRFFPNLSEAMDDKRAKVQICDGVDFVQKSDAGQFDVVIVDSTDPIGPGVGLFSASFYAGVKRVLKEDGIVVAQCESPWQKNVNFQKVYGNLNEVSDAVYAMVGSIPTYPLGFWSWGVATRKHDPRTIADSSRLEAVIRSSRYYNEEIHRAAFALPNFFKRSLEGVAKNAG